MRRLLLRSVFSQKMLFCDEGKNGKMAELDSFDQLCILLSMKYWLADDGLLMIIAKPRVGSSLVLWCIGAS